MALGARRAQNKSFRHYTYFLTEAQNTSFRHYKYFVLQSQKESFTHFKYFFLDLEVQISSKHALCVWTQCRFTHVRTHALACACPCACLRLVQAGQHVVWVCVCAHKCVYLHLFRALNEGDATLPSFRRSSPCVLQTEDDTIVRADTAISAAILFAWDVQKEDPKE